MVIKPPMVIDYENETVEDIVKRLQIEIEQDPSFLKVIPVEDYVREQKELDKKREFWQMY
jgi:hypothetical protein